MKRRYLFLQGVCSPFFARLSDSLTSAGHDVVKVNFNVGDLAYWRAGKSINFRGEASDLTGFLDGIYRNYSITDQVLFGDRRPVHRPAVDHAECYGIRTHVFEEGYFRPYWVTLEREGVNGHSLLPRDPDWFWTVGGDLPEANDVDTFQSSFGYRVVHDVAYHVVGALNFALFPNYQTHAPVNAAIEYLAYLRRFASMRLCKKRDAALITWLVESGQSYFVLPLQLNSDAQIRDHSRFDDMVGVMDFVMASFAQFSNDSTRLVIKNHPLDIGLLDYRSEISQLCKRYQLDGRVDYLESGDLDALIRNAKGVVTVNSTVGTFALGLECPTVTLSDPIYNLEGLTFQGGLDQFWTEGKTPNREMFRRFRNAVMFATQINGGFYCSRGIKLAVRNAASVLMSESSPLETLF